MSRARVLLADDHVANAALIHALLQPEFEVVGAVTDGRALVDAAEALSPDVIVTDVGMPGLDGIAAAVEILRKNPKARVVFVTVHDDSAVAARVLATGALGYVLKLAAGDELVPAVQAALRGERYVTKVSGLQGLDPTPHE
jgi:DNA-binding NarL/FixJ family response regulator